MKTFRIFIFILPVLFSSLTKAEAQDKDKIHNFKLGFEAGFNAYWGDVVKPERAREEYSAYKGYQDVWGLASIQSAMAYHVGGKSEYFFFRNRVGVAAGIRVSKFSSAFESNNSYPVMWLLQQEDANTYYVRIRSITQNSYYIGIPLEIRFFPNRRELPFQHYLKMGVAFSYRVHSEYKTRFYDEQMHRHAKTIEAQLGKPNAFNSYIYPTLGFKIGRSSSPWLNLEMYCSVLISRQTISFMKNGAGLGLQLSVQLPLGKSAPIASE